MRLRASISGGLALVLLAAAAGLAQNAGDKPRLDVTLETQKFTIPGLDKLPPEALKALGGLGGRRGMRVSLWSPGAAPSAAAADLDIPADLKMGKTLSLEIPKKGRPGDPGDPAQGLKQIESFEFIRYWGCSETVKPGQPRVVKGAELSAEQQARAAKAARDAGGKAPESTYAYWPNSKSGAKSEIKPDAAAPGPYHLKTTYTGNVAFEVPAKVTFLDPIDVSNSTGDLSKSITLSWKPVPNAVGYSAMAMGTKGKNVHIMWISSEVADGFEQGMGTTAEVQALVQKGIYMAPGKTSCSIPAGIFQGCQNVSVSMVAYGPSFTQGNTTPSVRVLTESRSILTLGLPAFGND